MSWPGNSRSRQPGWGDSGSNASPKPHLVSRTGQSRLPDKSTGLSEKSPPRLRWLSTQTGKIVK